MTHSDMPAINLRKKGQKIRKNLRRAVNRWFCSTGMYRCFDVLL